MLLIGVLGVAVTCVHELVVFHPTSRRWRGFDIEQLPQMLDVSSFVAFGENICRHRPAFDPLEARFVAG